MSSGLTVAYVVFCECSGCSVWSLVRAFVSYVLQSRLCTSSQRCWLPITEENTNTSCIGCETISRSIIFKANSKKQTLRFQISLSTPFCRSVGFRLALWKSISNRHSASFSSSFPSCKLRRSIIFREFCSPTHLWVCIATQIVLHKSSSRELGSRNKKRCCHRAHFERSSVL